MCQTIAVLSAVHEKRGQPRSPGAVSRAVGSFLMELVGCGGRDTKKAAERIQVRIPTPVAPAEGSSIRKESTFSPCALNLPRLKIVVRDAGMGRLTQRRPGRRSNWIRCPGKISRNKGRAGDSMPLIELPRAQYRSNKRDIALTASQPFGRSWRKSPGRRVSLTRDHSVEKPHSA